MQLDGGDRGRAIAEVDHDGRVAVALQAPGLGSRQPAVDPAQPVGIGGAAGDGAHRPLTRHAVKGTGRRPGHSSRS